MNLNQLRIFHVAAKLQSFTLASEHLHLTQPGISKHIKGLEEHYGLRLFDRLGKKVVLTQAGEILFAATGKISNLLNDVGKQIDDLKGLSGGKLTLGASFTAGTYILPTILGNYRKKYPDVQIQLDIALSRQISEKVLMNTLDLGFVGHSVYDERLIIKNFFLDELVVIVPADHEWASKKTVWPDELVRQQFILARQGSGTRKSLEEKLKKIGVTLEKTLEFGNTETVKKAVEAGLGISIISGHAIVRELSAGTLKALSISKADFTRTFSVIHLKDKYLNNAVTALLNFLPAM